MIRQDFWFDLQSVQLIKLREDTQPFSLGNFDGLYFIHILNPEKDRKCTQIMPKG